jgi:hypothetical protein
LFLLILGILGVFTQVHDLSLRHWVKNAVYFVSVLLLFVLVVGALWLLFLKTCMVVVME